MTKFDHGTSDRGLLETRFSMGAAALAAVAALLALAFGYLGFIDGVLPGIGYQLSILTGAVGLVFGFRRRPRGARRRVLHGTRPRRITRFFGRVTTDSRLLTLHYDFDCQ